MRKLMGEGVFSDEGQLQMVSNVGAINFCQTLQAVFHSLLCVGREVTSSLDVIKQ